MKKIIASFIILLTAGVASAQTKWSLDSCINYAISHSITVKNAEVQKDLAEISVTEERRRLLLHLPRKHVKQK